MNKHTKYVHIINWIDTHKERTFAVHELRGNIIIDRDTLNAIFGRLQNMNYLRKLRKGYLYRFWLVTSKWSTAKEVIKDYELYMTLRLSARRELP